MEKGMDDRRLRIRLRMDGEEVTADPGWTVAALLERLGRTAARRSVLGERRAPLCGMGLCFECRVTIDGERHRRGCQVLCREGMEVVTDG
jgi:predicted molibdopterin-dependent oxidoreductase YjgC